jgi:hypothetical protein
VGSRNSRNSSSEHGSDFRSQESRLSLIYEEGKKASSELVKGVTSNSRS